MISTLTAAAAIAAIELANGCAVATSTVVKYAIPAPPGAEVIETYGETLVDESERKSSAENEAQQ